MLKTVFEFWSKVVSNIGSWLINDFVINESPRITFGQFFLACAFIGVVLYFILGTDFIPGLSLSFHRDKSNSNTNYQPRHAPGNAGKDYSTRVSRHNYKD